MAITTLAQVKTILGISGTTQDALITTLIPMIEEQYQIIQGKTFEVEEEATIYPLGSELIAIQMVQQQLNFKSRNGKSSEKLGDYSVSYMDYSEYDKNITGRIRKYVRML